MLSNAILRLYVGPAIPLPAGPDVMRALVSASVGSASATGPGVFQLVFDLERHSPLHTLFVLSGAAPLPMVRVVIAASVNGVETVLIDGVMTNHEVSPGPAAGVFRLSVTGEDLSRVMDYVHFDGIPYPAMPDFARVGLVLAKYAFLGIIPRVVPSPLVDVPLPSERIPRHQGKDLGYIRMLADRVGYVFMMQPGDVVGTSIAYWGPQVRLGEVQPALNFDMDAHRNIETISGSFDGQNTGLPVVHIQNPETKATIPIPVVTPPILDPPLGAVRPVPLQVEPVRVSAKYNPIQAALIGMAKAAKANRAPSRLSGQLDASRYGRLLQPHKLVGLRGFGPAFDGLHYVETVRTNFEPGSLTQSFELSRNGLFPTVERVPT